ncbi:MAG: NAD(P)-binding protein [Bacillota bacterium]
MMDSARKSGAVLVLGGGISGMQSALDLAEAGLRVYLADSAPAIGGTMARLDKTFPTNDCAMCIMSPKLVDTGRHLNVEIIPGATLLSVEGEPGAFSVRLSKKARYVDLKKCTSCGDCARACPIDRSSEFDGALGTRKAIYKMYPQATPNAYAVEKRGIPPCRAACPAGVNAQAYVALLAQGKYREALDVIYRDLPFPSVCGRVCQHPCEAACHRGRLDAPVSIMALKRTIADTVWLEGGPQLVAPTPRPEKVAVVGAGPAGLSCAYHLARKGISVTVFEKLPVPGGMMVVGIPSYRLPRDVVQKEIDVIRSLGVDIRTGQALGKDFSIKSLFEKGFSAVYVAVGAHRGRRLGVPGEDLPGVIDGVEFLRKVSLGQTVTLGARVAVVGGGNTAMDAARTAVRLGASEVTVVYRRTEQEITALPEEIEQAKEEGVRFLMLTSPQAFLGTGKLGASGRLARMECLRNELGEPDASGRRRPVPVKGSEFYLDVDTVILAVGQATDTKGLDELRLSGGTIAADPLTLETSIPGVFAGGDAVSGPGLLIQAVAAGKRAAESIVRFLDGEDLREGRTLRVPEEEIAPYEALSATKKKRAKVMCRPAGDRRQDFKEVEFALDDATAREEASRCLACGACCECLECEKVCGPGAIDHRMTDEVVELTVGSVILSPGFSLFDAAKKGEYGFGQVPNVISSIQFERMLSASGPYQGHVVRPSDHKEPKRIAFIQCVGSRDCAHASDYCSAVCCMHATKEAVIAKEHLPGVETTIFYMDVRAFGKDFERYYERAKEEYGVRYVRAMVSSVKEVNPSGNLRLRYHTESGFRTEEFDLVVLSVGFLPAADAQQVASSAGILLDEHGFPVTDPLLPVASSRPGVFVSGAFSGPKDIPETVTEASAAAACASELLSGVRHTLTRVKRYPSEREVRGQEPRVGVFVCHCGRNIGSVVNVPEVVAHACAIPGVVHADEFLYACAQDSIEKIKERIKEYGLNRVVVASCTPRTHEALFRDTLREAGLNMFLFELASIREHSSWVHRDYPVEATAKAKTLVSMAVAKARLLEPLYTVFSEIEHTALVVGGGITGMTAALSLARQGFSVHLVEKEAELGGNYRHVKIALSGENPGAYLEELIGAVMSCPDIRVYTSTEVADSVGYKGNYKTTLRSVHETLEVRHGAVVIATGATEMTPKEYGYGESDRVITQRELEEMLAKGFVPQSVAMIQCVGSRDDDHPYCSRICCTNAVKNALYIKSKRPDAKVYVFYRDMRTYGFREKYYRQAREAGVLFIRYDPDEKPRVSPRDDGVVLTAQDPAIGREVRLSVEYLVLSTGVAAGANEHLARVFKLPLNQDGFFSEAHMKLRPVDFAADGIYLAGLAHSPKLAPESVAQAKAAAIRAVTLLSKDRIESEATIAAVRERICSACGVCVSACPYEARCIDEERNVAAVREVLCQGCGACVAACPNGASVQRGFDKSQIMAMLDEALSDGITEVIRE